MQELILKAYTTYRAKIVAYRCITGKKKQAVMRATLNGTVTSGKPTPTTLGNTLRVIMYIMFIVERCGIPVNSVRPFVSGDDSFIIVERRYCQALMDGINTVYYTEERNLPIDGRHGLGL